MSATVDTASDEIRAGKRFGFGKNWSRYLEGIDEERIETAVRSLSKMLRVTDLKGKSFLDIGSGSGLFSLAAKRLGAARIYSFDYDEISVDCTRTLKQRFAPGDPDWTIEAGSALDAGYVQGLGVFDVVYSWGVLHHTGRMYSALRNAGLAVGPDGMLYIAIYNDQGVQSRAWRTVKGVYSRGRMGRVLVLTTVLPVLVALRGLKDLVTLSNPLRRYSPKYTRASRGMSPVWDLIDWLGGYPFEVATPEAIFEFYRKNGFVLDSLQTTQGTGCNEFVFRRRGYSN